MRFLGTLRRQENNLLKAKDYDSLADYIGKSFNSKFWNWSETALLDVIEGYSMEEYFELRWFSL